MHRKYRRRGVSPVIAVLMLIAIAVATGIIVYVWVMGLSGSLTKSGGTQVSEQLELEAYDWTGNNLTIHIRNVGGGTVTVAEIYINGVQTSFTGTTTISPQSTANIEIDFPTPPSDGTSHTVKIVTSDGGVFAFTVVKGRSE